MALYIGAVLLVFFLRIIGVAIGTVRILLTNRGNEWWSAVLGFFEVLVYVIGIGVVVKDLTNITMLMSYSLGFSVGTILGIRVEQRLALGFVNLRAISRAKAPAIANALREAGFGATLSHGEGRDGSVGIITATVQRKHSRHAMNIIQGLDPEAFMVADEARAVARGWLPSAASVFPAATTGAQRVLPDIVPPSQPGVEPAEEGADPSAPSPGSAPA